MKSSIGGLFFASGVATLMTVQLLRSSANRWWAVYTAILGTIAAVVAFINWLRSRS